jgi:alpha-methylacyl-CoA racemase
MTSDTPAAGPPQLKVLAGVKVVEFGGIGPGPFAGMVLADHGADVHSLVRPTSST